MKKIFLCFLCVLCLAGCGEKEVAPTMDGITFDAMITFGGYSCVCAIDLDSIGAFTSTVKNPESISGTEVAYDGDVLTITYMGLTYTPQLPLPNETLDEILHTVLQAVSAGTKQAQEKDGSFFISGETAGYDYTLFITEAGLPLSLNCPRAGFSAEFSNVKIK